MTIIPELRVRSRTAAEALLCGVFGFAQRPDGRLTLGSQTLALAEGEAAGHGLIDHLALATPDLARDAAALLARGAEPDPAVTPDGPLGIPEFWGGGVRYQFFRGPGGARIELIENLAAARPPGHDHIGIPCTDIAASAAFALSLGARPLADYRLVRPDGTTEVRFLSLGTSTLEFYQPPSPPAPATPGLWSRLLIPGASPQTGPDGLTIAPA